MFFETADFCLQIFPQFLEDCKTFFYPAKLTDKNTGKIKKLYIGEDILQNGKDLLTNQQFVSTLLRGTENTKIYFGI